MADQSWRDGVGRVYMTTEEFNRREAEREQWENMYKGSCEARNREKQELLDVQAKNSVLMAANNQLTREKEDWRRSCNLADARVETLGKEIVKLKEDNKHTAMVRDNHWKNYQQCKAEMERLASENVQLEGRLSLANKSSDHNLNRASEISIEREKLRDNLIEVKAELERKTKEMSQCHKAYDALCENERGYIATITDLKAALKTNQETRLELMKERDEYYGQSVRLKGDIKAYQLHEESIHKVKQLARGWEQKCEEWERKYKELDRQFKAKEEKIKWLEHECSVGQEGIEEMENLKADEHSKIRRDLKAEYLGQIGALKAEFSAQWNLQAGFLRNDVPPEVIKLLAKIRDGRAFLDRETTAGTKFEDMSYNSLKEYASAMKAAVLLHTERQRELTEQINVLQSRCATFNPLLREKDVQLSNKDIMLKDAEVLVNKIQMALNDYGVSRMYIQQLLAKAKKEGA